MLSLDPPIIVEASVSWVPSMADRPDILSVDPFGVRPIGQGRRPRRRGAASIGGSRLRRGRAPNRLRGDRGRPGSTRWGGRARTGEGSGRAARDRRGLRLGRRRHAGRAPRHGAYAPPRALGCSTGPRAQPLYVARLREMQGREHGQAYDRGQPRGSADLLDYVQQGSTCRTTSGVRRCRVSCRVVVWPEVRARLLEVADEPGQGPGCRSWSR